MSTKLFVGNLSFNTTENDLNDAFAAHGTVVETNLMVDRATGRPRGFGFVTMSTPEEAQKVVPQKGAGCERCNGSGYKGRVGLYEVMEITDELRELILVGASALELRRKAVDEGMITLRRSGLQKVMEGVTTIEEVARETVK